MTAVGFAKDYPELAAMFQALQDGAQELALVFNGNATADLYSAGDRLAGMARLEGAGPEVIAAGLRMVADAIDPLPISRLPCLRCGSHYHDLQRHPFTEV